MSSKNYHQLTREPSGIKGLDVILRGGFFAGGLYIVEGPPGVRQDHSGEPNLLQPGVSGKKSSLCNFDI